jgi:hypothetical protein
VNHEESQELLGAYAVHAVDGEELVLLEDHLASCPRCRQELVAYLESAVALGNSGEEAPPVLWDRIAASLSERPPPLRLVRERPRENSRWVKRAVPVVASAAAAALAFLGWDVAHLDARVSRLQSAMSKTGLAEAADAAAIAPGSRHVFMKSSSGSPLAEVVLLPDGQAFVLPGTLPTLPNGETYQLWGLAGRSVISLGLLGRQTGPAAFRFGPQVSKLMITAEPAAGVPAPTSPVVGQAAL